VALFGEVLDAVEGAIAPVAAIGERDVLPIGMIARDIAALALAEAVAGAMGFLIAGGLGPSMIPRAACRGSNLGAQHLAADTRLAPALIPNVLVSAWPSERPEVRFSPIVRLVPVCCLESVPCRSDCGGVPALAACRPFAAARTARTGRETVEGAHPMAPALGRGFRMALARV
jgi:hypothetical protein